MNKFVDWKKPKNLNGTLKNETHVWRLPLELTISELEKAKSLLGEDEKTRAERFYFDKHRNHYVAARSQMRKLLGLYLDTNSDKISSIFFIVASLK